MNVQELRIGNYVKIDGKIFQLNRKRFEYLVCHDCCKGAEPILLTEEILLKCGFVKTFEGGTLWYLDDFFVASLDFIYWSGIKVKYLHQLQNLYFALTRKELNIEL